MPTKIKITLLLILLLAASLRLFNLDHYPDLNPDEAALGYNALSLLNTGKDEYGHSFPLHFQSFNDFKPGGYVYLAMPFVKLFGLTPFAVRLPNLLLSIISLYFLFKLIILLTQNQSLALISTFIAAINPWAIHFSRGAWESMSALSLTIIALYYLYLYLSNFQPKFLSLSAIFLALPLYFYHSARVFVPILTLTIFILNFKSFQKHPRHLVLPLILGFLLLLPVTFSFFTSGGQTRFNGVGILADSGPLSRTEELINQHQPSRLFRLLHHRYLLYTLSWLQKYFSHFDFNFLFLSGDEVPRSKIPNFGQFYLFEIFFFLIGSVKLFSSSFSPQFKKLIVSWLLIAPLASSLTFQAPSALRSLPLFVPLTIIIAIGISRFKPFTLVLYLFSLSFYLYSYYFLYLPQYPFAWNAGFSSAISYLNQVKNNYPQVYFTDKYDQPYILYLFFSHYPPLKAQSQLKLTSPDKFGFSTVRQIDNLTFAKIEWEKIPIGSLVITDPQTLPGKLIYEVKVQNQPLFLFYEKI